VPLHRTCFRELCQENERFLPAGSALLREMTVGTTCCATFNSFLQETFFKVMVTRISPDRFGSRFLHDTESVCGSG
jgi:hypothetical protein